ncbi:MULTISPECIES: ABC transporter permease [unclassified Bacillus (in: firmicutes)]|uniref:ABC transporter permease n=1 Tax=unclassified Bacillus (in: firmicutes) TaxID=185979 RepID=UPI0008E94E53|nr:MULTISPECIES: ABC transporter permease [unclassified Bacillus (in: firmicutes)]SFI69882.1 hypothetical protein SAMN04488574_10432 [Bacillus sp. 71mf]SFS89718.1 hypothetical protein SAMN04488145_104334 [Bacillus sp. 103mf]
MLNILRIEWLKLRRSQIILLATILPLFAVFQGRMFVLSQKELNGVELWSTLYTGSMSQFSSFIFPVSIAVIMVMITRIEHSNNGWKQLLAMPVKRENVYFSKLLMGSMITLYSVLIFSIGTITVGIELGLKDTIPYDLLVCKSLIVFIASLPIIAIQFYISFRFSHIGIPLAVGAGLALPSMLVANSAAYWIYYPWAYPIISSMTEIFSFAGKEVTMYTVCFSSFFLIIFIGLLKFRAKDVI